MGKIKEALTAELETMNIPEAKGNDFYHHWTAKIETFTDHWRYCQKEDELEKEIWHLQSNIEQQIASQSPKMRTPTPPSSVNNILHLNWAATTTEPEVTTAILPEIVETTALLTASPTQVSSLTSDVHNRHAYTRFPNCKLPLMITPPTVAVLLELVHCSSVDSNPCLTPVQNKPVWQQLSILCFIVERESW